MTEPTGTWKGRPLYKCKFCPFSDLDAGRYEAHVRVEHAPPKPNALRPITQQSDETAAVETTDKEEPGDGTSNADGPKESNKQPARRRAAH